MKLTLDQIRAITHGALTVAEVDGGFCFARFSPRQQAYYDMTHPDFGKKAHATSGVRLEFLTDSDHLSFTYTVSSASSRPFCFFDVSVDGVLLLHHGEEQLQTSTDTVSLALPAGTHRVAVYLPCLFRAVLSNVTLDDGATLTPVERSCRLLCFGDSITQGYDAHFPSQCYTNLLADLLDAEMVDQGIGGERFCPDLLDKEMNFDPDIITVAYGTNDWRHSKQDRMAEAAREFYRRLRALYPTARIFAITPTWRGDLDLVTEAGSFAEGTAIVREAALAQPGITVIDGMGLVPHVAEVFDDSYLHPSDLGFRFYADALFAQIKKSL